MVDSTRGLGPVPGVTQSGKTQGTGTTKRSEEGKEIGRAQDVVEISQAALDHVEAQKAAEEARETLKQNKDLTLGLNPSLLDETA